MTQGPGSGITGRLAQGAAKNGFVQARALSLLAVIRIAHGDRVLQDVSAFNFAYADNGLFGVLATAERGNVSALVEALTRDLAVVARNVSAEEVARAKAQAKAEILFKCDMTLFVPFFLSLVAPVHSFCAKLTGL